MKWRKTGLVFISFIILFYFVSSSLKPYYIDLACQEVKRFIQLVINHVNYTTTINQQELLDIKYDNHEISHIQFNMFELNKLSSRYIQRIENTLFSIENGTYKEDIQSIYSDRLKEVSYNKGIITSIPVGTLFHNMFLQNIGPSLDVCFHIKSLSSSHLKKDIKDYGINYIAISIDLYITIELQIMIPFASKVMKNTFKIPVVFEIIEGDIPEWYKIS